ncbi:Small Molecule Metabolism [Candidatus Rhodobacter oscarellae]|uniref:Small Molecule Metabolism n=1 Tax=Candidatus Rhodobacter oscarellae TaxID=1675527 RepID=A0A0J9ED40_9RHOB|nr:Gfo/Idh/MocA family oxidoreductase [Candidatus Rhodobacter lobularis]KMW60717.1 Small Molecule Metabolism [Candidatus Rhodobacter lobularis]
MRVGIVGLGDRIATLAPEFAKAQPAIEYTAVVDPSDTRLPVLTALGAQPQRYDNINDMLAGQRFDLLIIGSPNHLHLEHLSAALRSDVPYIFTEKPVVISVDETLELARLIAEHDGVKRMMVGLVLRYSPLYRALRSAQADGHLGEIMSIEASEHIAPYHGSFFMRDWRRDSNISGGFMLEKCCHDLDLYQGLVDARPTKIASFGGRKKYLPQHRPAEDLAYLQEKAPRWQGINDAFSGAGDLIDYQTALVQYENGASMAFHTNMNVPDEFRRFAVIGRDGMAEGDFIRNTFRVTRSDDGSHPVDLAKVVEGGARHDGHYGADGAMARDLMAHMAGHLPDLPLSCIDALEAGLTAMAMDEAMRDEKIVDMAPTWAAFDAALGIAEEAA